jgi:hypothetical protein
MDMIFWYLVWPFIRAHLDFATVVKMVQMVIMFIQITISTLSATFFPTPSQVVDQRSGSFEVWDYAQCEVYPDSDQCKFEALVKAKYKADQD